MVFQSSEIKQNLIKFVKANPTPASIIILALSILAASILVNIHAAPVEAISSFVIGGEPHVFHLKNGKLRLCVGFLAPTLDKEGVGCSPWLDK